MKLNVSSSLPVTVDYATSDGTATAGADYTAADGTLSFMPGDIEQTISVLLQADELYEADETFVLTLSNAVNAELAGAAATGTIADSDDAPELTVADAARGRGCPYDGILGEAECFQQSAGHGGLCHVGRHGDSRCGLYCG